MELKNYQNEILQALINNEEALSDLYTKYGEKFPDYKEFWVDLAKDEKSHANWLRKFAEKIKDGSVYFNEDRFKIEALRTYFNEVEKYISEATFMELLPINTLSTAYYLEMSLIERKYFEVFEGDSVELKHVLKALTKATKKHEEKISEQLNKLKSK